jgi:hypothetical protein
VLVIAALRRRVTGEHTRRLCTSPNPFAVKFSSQGPAADVRMARRRVASSRPTLPNPPASLWLTANQFSKDWSIQGSAPAERRRSITTPTKNKASTRRHFLKVAAAGSAATVAVPSIVNAQGPVSMRFQSTWAAKDIFHEYALDYAKKVNDMTGGDLRIEVLPAGAVVPAFGLLDAVSKGTLDGGHGVLVYHYGKQTALALWGSGPGYAMDANMLLLAWHRYGGGKELLSKLYTSIGANVVSFPHGPMPTQPLGWFKNPVTKADDLKGVKFRTVGISIDVFTGLGAAVNALPGGEIVSAMDRGLLDVRSSTMRRRTASWASRMSPRSACCRVIIRMPSSSRSCSTRRSMTRCLSQAIIFILGWPLEWTEIIVIFVPIFLPMLKHFSIDPVLAASSSCAAGLPK